MFGSQQNLIRAYSSIQAILEYLCSESAKLTNCGIYYSRQIYCKNWQDSETGLSYIKSWELKIETCTIKRSIQIQLSKF